jgi:hypothetical protein
MNLLLDAAYRDDGHSEGHNFINGVDEFLSALLHLQTDSD